MIDARRRHDGVCGLRPGVGAYGIGGEDDEGVEGFCSFSLMRRNRRIKADIIGPIAQSGRFPAMSAMARAPSPVEGYDEVSKICQ